MKLDVDAELKWRVQQALEAHGIYTREDRIDAQEQHAIESPAYRPIACVLYPEIADRHPDWAGPLPPPLNPKGD